MQYETVSSTRIECFSGRQSAIGWDRNEYQKKTTSSRPIICLQKAAITKIYCYSVNWPEQLVFFWPVAIASGLCERSQLDGRFSGISFVRAYSLIMESMRPTLCYHNRAFGQDSTECLLWRVPDNNWIWWKCAIYSAHTHAQARTRERAHTAERWERKTGNLERNCTNVAFFPIQFIIKSMHEHDSHHISPVSKYSRARARFLSARCAAISRTRNACYSMACGARQQVVFVCFVAALLVTRLGVIGVV